MPVDPVRRMLVFAAPLAAWLFFAFDPAVTWWFPSCPFRALTGWLCPLCGSLRALHALLHGAPGIAFTMNPLTTAGVIAAIGALAHDVMARSRMSSVGVLLRACFSPRGLALIVAFGILRNVLAPLGWIVQ